MIIRELLRTLRRGWAIVLLVVLATGALGAHLLMSTGVYTSRIEVAFTLPDSVDLTDDGSTEPGIITFAATVAQEANGRIASPRYADADARAYGAGVRQGVFIRVPDVGGQWTVAYRRAVVDIDVVGPSEQWVHEQQDEALERVLSAADAQQDAIGIASSSRLIYSVEPFSDQIEHVAPGRTTEVIALAALAMAGLMVAIFAATRWDRWRTVRRVRERSRPDGARLREAELVTAEGMQ